MSTGTQEGLDPGEAGVIDDCKPPNMRAGN